MFFSYLFHNLSFMITAYKNKVLQGAAIMNHINLSKTVKCSIEQLCCKGRIEANRGSPCFVFGSQALLISYSNLLNPFGLKGPQKCSGNF